MRVETTLDRNTSALPRSGDHRDRVGSGVGNRVYYLLIKKNRVYYFRRDLAGRRAAARRSTEAFLSQPKQITVK